MCGLLRVRSFFKKSSLMPDPFLSKGVGRFVNVQRSWPFSEKKETAFRSPPKDISFGVKKDFLVILEGAQRSTLTNFISYKTRNKA
jgi:hypothetical protein